MTNTAQVTIKTTVNKPLSQVWDYLINPVHIKGWNFASDDWYCPKAVNNFVEGGTFSYTMAAKDGSMQFDFSGKFTEIVEAKKLVYLLDDNRAVWFDLVDNGNSVDITERFETETENPIDLQEFGWQCILNNFKKYTESI